MSAGIYNIELEQGSVRRDTKFFYQQDGETPIDFTGCTARMQERKTKASDFVIFELTTENGGLIIDPEGQLTFFLSAEQTTELDFESAVYDLEIVYSDGEPRRELEGKVLLSRDTTR